MIAALAVLTVVISVLPASMARRFLPAAVAATDFSGSVWHGAAGDVALNSLRIGAIEWHLHPWPLLALKVDMDLHWVKGGFVADGAMDFTPGAVTFHGVQGGGPLEDLHDFGIADGWHGTASFKFSEIEMSFASGAAAGGFATLVSAVGDLDVLNLSGARVGGGVNLGDYTLHVADVAIIPGADATASLTDTGGPLEVIASIHLSPDGRTGMLSGTIKARTDAPAALLGPLADLAQLHARDAHGAIPVELEFTL